jgi:phenylpropionate dioxygenase-like ring-hydroxylating dioxygenase large terminal subunit
MHTAPDFLRNSWYVAAWSQEITEDHLLPRTITRVPLVLWRDRTGKVVAPRTPMPSYS